MYDVQFLSQKYGLTIKQVRDRLTVLAPMLTTHTLVGKHGAKVLTDGGLAIFDRLIELERSGLSVNAAVEKVGNERSPRLETPESTTVSVWGTNGEPKVIELMGKQIEDLRIERDRLLAIIESQGEHIKALSPGPTPANGHKETQVTRWQAFRIAFLGR